MIKLTAAQCPNCGADIEVNENLKNSICQYCGSTILVEEALQKVELSGKVKVDGIVGSSDKINDIKKYIKLKEYQNAIKKADEIISKEPFNYEAQALKIKCYIYDFNFESFNPNSFKSEDKENWEKIDEVIRIYNRMNAVDEEKVGEKELTDVKDELDKMIKWYEDNAVAEEERKKAQELEKQRQIEEKEEAERRAREAEREWKREQEKQKRKNEKDDAMGGVIFGFVLSGLNLAGTIAFFVNSHKILGAILAVFTVFWLIGGVGNIPDVIKNSEKKDE